jgi:hypothetical protein
MSPPPTRSLRRPAAALLAALGSAAVAVAWSPAARAEALPAYVADCLDALATQPPGFRGGAALLFTAPPDHAADGAAPPDGGAADEPCAGLTVLDGGFAANRDRAVAIAGHDSIWIVAAGGATHQALARLPLPADVLILLRPVEGERFASESHERRAPRARSGRPAQPAAGQSLDFYTLALNRSGSGALVASLYAVLRDQRTGSYQLRHLLDRTVGRP